jgi:ProP effector
MTDSSNAQSRRQRSEIARTIRYQLVDRFPAAFKGKGMPKVPLAIGIFKEIKRRAPEITRHDLNIAMQDYTGGWKYLRAIVEGTFRVDLDGNPVSAVTAAHAADARRRLEKLEARKKGRSPHPDVKQAAE